MKSLHSTKRRTSSLTIIIIVIAGVALLGGAWYFLFQNKPAAHTNTDGVNVVNYDPPTPEELQAAEARKDELIADEERKNSLPTDTALNIFVSRSFQEAGAFHLRTVISGTSTGECVITFTKTGQPTVTKSFSVTFEATSAFCKDASVPVGDFAISGSWDYSLIVKKDNNQSPAATGTAEITK